MPSIVVAGSINQDLVIRSPRIPVPGESVIGRDLSYVRGGKGANQAVACARLGATTHFIGRVGADPFGESLIAGLIENGVDTSMTRRDPHAPSGVAVITIDPSGENAIVVAPGANARCDACDIPAALPAGTGAVLCQLETSLPFVEAALRAGRQAGALTILDAAPAPSAPLSDPILSWVDLLTCNETEARVLLGMAPDEHTSDETLADALATLGPATLVLKLGERGGLAWRAGERVRVVPPRVHVVDTTGAGDAFTGALAVALSESLDLADSLAFAVHAGSLACTVLGAQPSMPSRAQVEQSLAADPHA